MKKTLYKNMHLINGHKDISMIDNGILLVDEKGIIAYAGDESGLDSSYDENTHKDKLNSIKGTDGKEDLQVIDLKGAYVMPGLINAHGHYFNSGKPVNNFPPLLVKLVTWFLKTWMGKLYLRIIYPGNYQTALNAGITTVRDVGSFYYNDIRCRDRIAEGKMRGPRIIACGSLITSTGGHGYEFPDRKVADNPWEDRKAVREHILHQVDWIKICNTAGVSDARFVGEAGQPTMTEAEIAAACDEAHSRGFMVATHCESTEGIRRALEGGVDSIEHGAPIPEELVPLFKNNPKALRGYTALVPTLSTFFIPDFEHKLKPTPANKMIIENTRLVGEGCASGLRTAIENGIHLGIGNDSGIPRVTHYNLYQELQNFQKHGGLSAKEIIHIATVGTSELIGTEKVTGSLDKGKSADFIVLDANPLEDLSHLYKPKHVVARGQMIWNPRFKVFKNI